MPLVDTNIVSELMRPAPHPGVLAWLRSLRDSGVPLAVSAITVDEIIFGLTRKPKPMSVQVFEQLLAHSVVLNVTESIARRAGEMRALLAGQGKTRSQADMLIAATAQVHALTLVTRNERDFESCAIAVRNPFVD
ncbi:type II toxin-antitoxin system VapC family toxin [Ottowia testudinis]|uniref:Ribonuclease VapC n=1 Tax=Ottowia testudinis TaxID=2816950 RepID=A0A975CC28_9BURK|nr:type II toxin-antitoxin system VapC family toxin [Ottowia testudinis]QTD43703.1 type II toxin-antitoxin system VapC family toxin [Ottowia testudinis]